MKCLLSSFVITATFASLGGMAIAQAPCFEPSIGTSIGTGDDVVLPMQPIGFAFPFAGTTYTDIHPCTNGFLYLSNNNVPAPTQGALCCTGTTAALVAGTPKICPRLDDLNILAATTGAGVFVNTTIAGKCVVTWQNAVEYSNTIQFTMQVQLFATGEITMSYSAGMSSLTAGDALVGMSPGAGAAVPAVSDLFAGGVSTGSTVYELFDNTMAQPWDLAGNSITFTPAGTGYGFGLGCGGGPIAFHQPYGLGCYEVAGSVYEDFPASAFDLSGQTLSMLPAGGGYLWLANPISTWFTPVNAVTPLFDDSLTAAIPLPTSFPYAGSSISTAITVHSNGQVFLGAGSAADYSPSVLELLSRGPSVGPWMDLNPGDPLSGGVVVDFDAVNNLCIVTWNGVFAFGTTLPQTFQIVLSLTGSTSPGTVELRFQSLANVATLATNMLLAYTPGTTTRDPGNRDFSALVPFVSPAEAAALALSASPAPSLGATVTYTISNIPAAAVASADILSLYQQLPPFDLGLIGAPGCWQHINLGTSASVLLFGGPTASHTFNVPTGPAWLGFTICAQGASLVPGINALGVITSNGILSTFN